ncbi:hypothetical protein EB118_17685 [bacterium]|nr:hypothetical protein [bacterium]
MNLINLKVNKEHKQINTTEFMQLQPNFLNRDSKTRAETSEAHMKFNIFLPWHGEVVLVRLTKDITYGINVYKKGETHVMDANTRQNYWKNNSTVLPDKLNATIYYIDNYNDYKALYESFDSITSVETKSQAAYTYMTTKYGYTPKATKLKKCKILTDLALAAHMYDSKKYFRSAVPRDMLEEYVDLYFEEYKWLDQTVNLDTEKVWDSHMKCAFIVAAKKWKTGLKRTKLEEAALRIQSKIDGLDQTKNDSVSKIIREFFTNSKGCKYKKETNWILGPNDKGALDARQTVSFILYHLEVFIENKQEKRTFPLQAFTWWETFLRQPNVQNTGSSKPSYNSLNNFFGI